MHASKFCVEGQSVFCGILILSDCFFVNCEAAKDAAVSLKWGCSCLIPLVVFVERFLGLGLGFPVHGHYSCITCFHRRVADLILQYMMESNMRTNTEPVIMIESFV
jgi:hypothetical protein